MISTNLERLQNSNERISLNIANAYVKAGEKGASLPVLQNSENLASTIESIEQGSNSWQPHPDWWDIDSILENDTEDYPAKMIWLLNDIQDTIEDFGVIGAVKVKLSDGAEYDTHKVNHTWDKSKDKYCSEGYNTRYAIFYFDTVEYNYFEPKWYNWVLNCVCENMNFHVTKNHLFTNFYCCSALKLKNCILQSSSITEYISGVPYERLVLENTIISTAGMTSLTFVGRPTDSQLNNLYKTLLPNGFKILNAQNIFSGMELLVKAPELRLADNVKSIGWGNAFYNCRSLRIILYIDFKYATNFSNIFFCCYSLEEIIEIYNIETSGLNLSYCALLNYETLLRIIDALCDYSDDTENVHSIIFGPTLLAKLSDEDKARIIRKGWTAS